MSIDRATPQDTFDHIFGSGATSYEWWLRTQTLNFLASDLDVPDDWAVKVTVENPSDGAPVVRTVDHKVIMMTARAIVMNNPEVPYVGETTRKQCRNLMMQASEADLDAVVADNVLQVAIFGEVIYG